MSYNFTKEQIQDQFDQLPPELRSTIGEIRTDLILKELNKKYLLHIDQLGLVGEGLTLVMIGLMPNQEFRTFLRTRAGISEDLANLITYDLNQQIFSKIREDLKKVATQDQNTTTPQQVFNQKMGGVSNVPKQEVEVETKTGDNKEEVANSKPPRDPYREPIN